ncbi:uncharacterized protein LOC123271894 [Cotesia glomerata]|nr:uncharacterized protein LOC123271894 [Cotesia glomerata]
MHWSDKDRATTIISEYRSERGTERRKHPRGLRTIDAALPHVPIRRSLSMTVGGKVSLPPILQPPQPLYNLIKGLHTKSKHFLENIRKYNAAFQMTSFRASKIFNDTYMPTFKVQGQVYHTIGSIYPVEVNQEKFLQVYFIEDLNRQAQTRCNNIDNIDNDLITKLQLMLHQNNIYVQNFKSAIECVPRDCVDLRIIIRSDKKPVDQHTRRYNAPTSNEVAVLMVGQEFNKRDIVLNLRNNTLQRINEIHRSYDCLQYPLIFCYGDDGYSIDIPQVNPVSRQPIQNKTVSAMSFYAFRIMVRHNNHNHLHYFRSVFSQFLVDMYAKIESERLAFIRNNQSKLRAENYIYLQDALRNDENINEIGKLVVLPSSFTAGYRYMHERTQDGMVYIRTFGKPDLFITFTCNPKWNEIACELLPGQKSQDRHDIIARVFRLKVKKLIDLITKKYIFGETLAHMYTVEWQKRGLPHIHILVWLKDKIKPEQIDTVISAEFPNPNEDPILFEIVKSNMIHGPCGQVNPQSPCMTDGKCTKKYPKQLICETQTGDDNYPKYRRRSPSDGGFTAKIVKRNGEFEVDNRWVVPYNPLLSRLCKAHVNVEYCNSAKSVKYICKYMNKGTDQATYSVSNENDEIQIFQSGRYISSSEAAWRILGFPIHERNPTVFYLAVHLDNGQRVYFNPTNIQNLAIPPPKTTLTEFFNLCSRDDFARTLLYCEVPSYYTWSSHEFHRRKNGENIPNYPGIKKSSALGRVYTVHPNNFECYCLRMLLHHIRGPTSFESLRTVNGQVYETYQAACAALKLLENDNHWDQTLEEAVVFNMPFHLRNLFVIILGFCHVAEPIQLWLKYRDAMAEDILYRFRQHKNDNELDFNDDIHNEALILIEDQLFSITGKTLKEFNFASPVRSNRLHLQGSYHRETNYNIEDLLNSINEDEPKLTDQQQNVYTKILESINEKQECSVIIWDECTMSHKRALEAVNRTMKDIRNDQREMGGITLVLAGDFRQTLPVVKRGTRADEVNACLKSSNLWPKFDQLSLSTNMRVHLYGDLNAEEFSSMLLEIGNGNVEEENGKIKIPTGIGTIVSNLDELIKNVYPDVKNLKTKSTTWLSERSILTSMNDHASRINDMILSLYEEEEKIYSSINTVVEQDDATNFPVEFLNSLNPPGMSNHILKLKIGAPIMLIRNLSSPKLCNGTRLQVISLKQNIIEAKIITGYGSDHSSVINATININFMNFQRSPFFRQGHRYEFTGYVQELFGYRELLFTDNFSFDIRDRSGDHVIMIVDNQHELESIIEINQVLMVRVVCQYGQSYDVGQNYSRFEFRVFSFNSVMLTSMFYVLANSTYERRAFECEMEED